MHWSCFMNMCELPVIYHTLFVIILHLVTYNNIIMSFLCYSGWHKSLLTNVYHSNRKEPLCQYLDFVLLCLPDRWLFRITNSNCVIHRVLLHLAILKYSFKTTLFSSFLTIQTCQFLIMTQISNLVHTTRFRNNLHQVRWKSNLIEILI